MTQRLPARSGRRLRTAKVRPCPPERYARTRMIWARSIAGHYTEHATTTMYMCVDVRIYIYIGYAIRLDFFYITSMCTIDTERSYIAMMITMTMMRTWAVLTPQADTSLFTWSYTQTCESRMGWGHRNSQFQFWSTSMDVLWRYSAGPLPGMSHTHIYCWLYSAGPLPGMSHTHIYCWLFCDHHTYYATYMTLWDLSPPRDVLLRGGSSFFML